MKNEDLKKYEDMLSAAQADLSREIKEVIQGADMGDVGNRDEGADRDEESGVAFAEQIALKGRLHAVLDAMERIKVGTYGVCVKCGGEISPAVLDAVPESSYCASCK
jgi:RNA polymerase-binding transcription factor DksA